MGDGVEQRVGALHRMIAILTIEIERAFARIKDDAPGMFRACVSFKSLEDTAADAVTCIALLNGHAPDLYFLGRVEMDPAGSHQLVPNPSCQMKGRSLMLIPAGCTYVGPRFAEDAPAEIVVQLKFGLSGRLPNLDLHSSRFYVTAANYLLMAGLT